jgi:hypothetical protein
VRPHTQNPSAEDWPSFTEASWCEDVFSTKRVEEPPACCLTGQWQSTTYGWVALGSGHCRIFLCSPRGNRPPTIGVWRPYVTNLIERQVYEPPPSFGASSGHRSKSYRSHQHWPVLSACIDPLCCLSRLLHRGKPSTGQHLIRCFQPLCVLSGAVKAGKSASVGLSKSGELGAVLPLELKRLCHERGASLCRTTYRNPARGRAERGSLLPQPDTLRG